MIPTDRPRMSSLPWKFQREGSKKSNTFWQQIVERRVKVNGLLTILKRVCVNVSLFKNFFFREDVFIRFESLTQLFTTLHITG